MTLEAAAEQVARGDPDRFLAAMAAPPADRARLLPIYAVNLEVARAPWASAEPLVAAMRLQFWDDLLDALAEGRRPAAHDLAQPLEAALDGPQRAAALAALQGLVAARRGDIGRQGFADDAALTAYLQATAGNLMWAAALVLGAPAGAGPAVRAAGYASGVTAWLGAVPALQARGLAPLPDPSPSAVQALARQGLAALATARAGRATVPARAGPALLAGWRSGALLRMAAAAPERVAQGQLVQSEFRRRGTLLLRSLTGRW